MTNKSEKYYFAKRVALFISGLITMAFGVALAVKADIGVAPGSVIPYSVSLLVPLSVGMCSTLFHALCGLIQLIMNRRVTLKLILQFPIAYVFGFLLDFFLGFMTFDLHSIVFRIIFILAAIFTFSYGLRAIVGANVLIMPPDGLTWAVGNKLNWPMSKSKLVYDIIVTVIGILIMWIFAGNAFLSVNIGTVICAVGTGPVIGLYTKLLPSLDMDK